MDLDNVTTRRAVLVMLGTIAVITSVTIAVIISGLNGSVTRTGTIKDTVKVGEVGGTRMQFLQELPRPFCETDEIPVWVPVNERSAEIRCVKKDAIR